MTGTLLSPPTFRKLIVVPLTVVAPEPTAPFCRPKGLDGPAPADGTPNTFLEMDDDIGSGGVYPDQLQVWNFHTDWATPANSTFTHATDPPVAAFSWPQCYYNGSRSCVPQPGTTRKLDAIPDRLMLRVQ